jgi:restriction system protein
MANHDNLPKYNELMLPVLRAIADLGGSATGREISDQVVEVSGFSDELIGVEYANRPVSVLLDRLDWARSYCKLAGTLESPKRSLFLLTPLGREILGLPDAEARSRLAQLDRQVRAARPVRQRDEKSTTPSEQEVRDAVLADEEDAHDDWREVLLRRLHQLTPTGFEEFCMYLLRRFGLHLIRVGGTGDEGIDGIGTAPLSDVLSATVAVQAKRFDPSSTIGRDTVALFQRDAAAAGAERAVFITLGRFSTPARKAATTVTPRVDLIDGERLCDLVLSQEIGLKLQPVVNEAWFDRFDTDNQRQSRP